MNVADELTREFFALARRKLGDECWPRICRCLDLLTEEQIWWRPNETSNSIGNLLLHLNGNLRQWVVAPLGGAKYERNRAAEFAQREQVTSKELRGQLGETVEQVVEILARLGPEELRKVHDIQNRQGVTALEAVFHIVEHFAMHYGQIAYVTKMLTGADLGFYRHLEGKR